MTGNQKNRVFDGVICIGGEDWWYHNRGHFDFQIMRRLSRRWPVLFVNSIGVRMPSLADKGLFAARFGRKLKSLARGVTQIESGFYVYSPVSVPGETGAKLSQWALAPQIKIAARRAGIKRPLLWVHCPAGAGLIDDIDSAAVVMQRTDRFEEFPEGDRDHLSRQIAEIKSAADLVVYAADHFAQQEKDSVARQLVVTHGVDAEAFITAGRMQSSGPADVAEIPRPRAGFIGGIDAHTFDPDLFLDVAQRLPDVQFVMVGGCSLAPDWCKLDNVHLLGRRPYESIARYMAAMDVLFMPWNQSDWIKSCNPIKLKEYLAVGRPVVSTDFPALDPWRDVVRVGQGGEAFAQQISEALTQPYDFSKIEARILNETWDAKARLVAEQILDLGLEFVSSRSVATCDPLPSRLAVPQLRR